MPLAIPLATLAVAAAGTGYSIYAGERSAAKQKEGMKLQEQAQNQAEAAASQQNKLGQEAANKAAAKTPDLNVLLGDQMLPKPGQRGINADSLLLGKPSLLGL